MSRSRELDGLTTLPQLLQHSLENTVNVRLFANSTASTVLGKVSPSKRLANASKLGAEPTQLSNFRAARESPSCCPTALTASVQT